jgi:hypothetical protein
LKPYNDNEVDEYIGHLTEVISALLGEINGYDRFARSKGIDVDDEDYEELQESIEKAKQEINNEEVEEYTHFWKMSQKMNMWTIILVMGFMLNLE